MRKHGRVSFGAGPHRGFVPPKVLFPGALQMLRLSIASNRLSTARLMDFLVSLPCDRIAELNASHNDLCDTAPRQLLETLPLLRTLALGGCGISAAGVRNLFTCLMEQPSAAQSPREFSPKRRTAGDNGDTPVIRDGGAAVNAKQVRGLESLDLTACSVAGAANILGAYLGSSSCTLTWLDLSYNALGPEAMRLIGMPLRNSSTMRALRLAHCRLREEAVTLLDLLSSDDSSVALRHLCLARNSLHENALTALGSFLDSAVGRGLTELDVSGNTLADEHCSLVLGKGLQGPGGTYTTASWAASSHVALGKSSSSGAVPKEASSEMSKRFVEVEMNLADAFVPPSTKLTSRLPEGQSLRLDLTGTRPFIDMIRGRWDRSAHVLTAIASPDSRVTEVILDQCQFSEATMPVLARACLNVRTFSLSSQALSEAFPRALNGIVRTVAGQKRAHPSVSVEDSSPSGIGTRCQRLRLWLTELRLNDATLSDTAAGLLIEALGGLRDVRRDRHDIEVLELAGNYFTEDAIEAIGPFFVENKQLRRIVLTRNKFRTGGALRLCEFLPLRADCAALDLELRHCHLTGDGAQAIWKSALSEGSNICSLDLAENAIDDVALAAMHDAVLLVPPDSMILVGASLLPNPCSTETVVRLLMQAGPWRKLSFRDATLDSSLVSQLLHCMGSEHLAELAPRGIAIVPEKRRRSSMLHSGCHHVTDAVGKVGHNAGPFLPSAMSDSPELAKREFSLNLVGSHLVQEHWNWSIVVDAVRAAMAPVRMPSKGKPSPGGVGSVDRTTVAMAKGAPWRRFGGCGGILTISLERCELQKFSFNIAPGSAPKCADSDASLARNARREIRARRVVSTSSHTVAEFPAPNNGTCTTAVGPVSLAAKARDVATGPACDTTVTSKDEVQCFDERRRTVCGGALLGPRENSIVSLNGSGHAVFGSSVNAAAQVVEGRGRGIGEGRKCGASFGPVNGSRGGPGGSVPIAVAGCSAPTGESLSFDDELFSPSYERKGEVDLDTSIVLRELRDVAALRLITCGLADPWLARLCSHGAASKWNNMRLLDLRHNFLTSTCCQAIVGVVAWGTEVVILDGNQIGAVGLEILLASCKPSQSCALRRLSVADNGIGHPGGFIAADCLARAGGCPLQSLCLARNPSLSSGDLVAILRALCRQDCDLGRALEVLDLSGTSPDSIVMAQLGRTLATCEQLELIDLRGTPLEARRRSGSVASGCTTFGASRSTNHDGTSGGASILEECRFLPELEEFLRADRVRF